VRNWLFVLAVVAALGLDLVAWFAVEDERQAAHLNARVHEAYDRTDRLQDRTTRLVHRGAPTDEVVQARLEAQEADNELRALLAEQGQREQSWPARVRQEVRRRTGW
jgi:flagellar basal body-associated protein FliL